MMALIQVLADSNSTEGTGDGARMFLGLYPHNLFIEKIQHLRFLHGSNERLYYSLNYRMYF